MKENLLITCAGRRVQLVQWFKEALNKIGRKVICADRDPSSPALYAGDAAVMISGDDAQELINAAEKYDCGFIITLIDTMLIPLMLNEKLYNHSGIEVFHSELNVLQNTLDKAVFWARYENIINIPQTCIVKDRYGSAGRGFEVVRQPLIPGKEYNVQAYFDFITGTLIDVFSCEKILMRAGETERGLSVYNQAVVDEVKKLELRGFKGPVDMDMIVSGSIPYVIDINPRFGGGYNMAHAAGTNFVEYFVNNMTGKVNFPVKAKFTEKLYLMKYDQIMVKSDLNTGPIR